MATATGSFGFPGSIEIDGVICYEREGEPGTWLYVPGPPVPETAHGRPTLNLFVSASGGVVQMGSQWTLTPQVLEKLKVELVKRTGRQEADLRLQPATASVKQVAVETGDGKGALVPVATSSSSGFPPYNAIFRVPLDMEKKNAVVAALNGRAGFLVVRYRGAASLKVSARAVLEGDVRQAIETLTSSSTRAQIRDWMNAALEQARLSLTVEGTGGAGAPLAPQARSEVMERFALALKAWLGRRESIPPTESLLRVEAVASEIVERELERSADVSAWFAPGEGRGHITVLPGGDAGPEPSPTEVRVGLGFPAAELPVAFVEARFGDKRALLRPPAFEPVALEAVGGALQLTTHYTTGQSPYKTQVEWSESGRLDPAALGLTQVVVDGAGRREAGVREIRMRLQFRPAGEGTPEDRTFYLQGQGWTASFFVVTRGQPMAGEFELEWTETTAQGEPRRRQIKAKDQAVFVLQEMITAQGA